MRISHVVARDRFAASHKFRKKLRGRAIEIIEVNLINIKKGKSVWEIRYNVPQR